MTNTCPELEEYLDRVVAFVMENRGDMKAIQGTAEEVKDRLRSDALQMSMCSFSRDNGPILGMVHGIPDHRKKLFHVSSIITKDKAALPAFIDMFDMLFPGYKLAGIRYGKMKHYNTERFKLKFSSSSKKK